MRFILFVVSFLLFISCKNNSKSEEMNTSQETKFEMYQISEMASLMEMMYADNYKLKENIIKGEIELGKLPSFYEKMEKATLTDPSDRDSIFNSLSIDFLNYQRLIYADKENIKTNFNNMVNSCIECHKIKCAGPIDRIKKLFIL